MPTGSSSSFRAILRPFPTASPTPRPPPMHDLPGSSVRRQTSLVFDLFGGFLSQPVGGASVPVPTCGASVPRLAIAPSQPTVIEPCVPPLRSTVTEPPVPLSIGTTSSSQPIHEHSSCVSRAEFMRLSSRLDFIQGCMEVCVVTIVLNTYIYLEIHIS